MARSRITDPGGGIKAAPEKRLRKKMDKQKTRSTSYKTKKYYKRKRTSTKALIYKAVQTEFRKNAEKKYYSETLNITGLSVTGSLNTLAEPAQGTYRDWETDRKSTRLNSSHRSLSRMPSSA